ncbi:trypsin-like serine peptidase [Streptomyces sp. NPDC001139]
MSQHMGGTGSVSAVAGLSPEAAALDADPQKALAQFWTPERKQEALRNTAATPEQPSGRSATGVSTTAPAGQPGAVAPQGPSVGAVSALPDQGSSFVSRSHATTWGSTTGIGRTAGRVFFTDSKNQLEACSATVVSTEAKNVVVTAAHCIRDSGANGAWHTNWVFDPGYNNGPSTDGTWNASYYTVTPSWVSQLSTGVDAGFVELHKNNSGAKIQEITGGQGILWNGPTAIDVDVFGYPAAAPFDGKTLMHCANTTSSLSDQYGTYEYVDCDMTAGSSGGPWLSSFNGNFGYVTTVESAGNSPMMGRYFGTEVGNLYNAVRYNSNY